MTFALPLTIGMLLLAFLLLIWHSRNESGRATLGPATEPADLVHDRHPSLVVAIVVVAAALWLTEPFHHVPAAAVALGAAAFLFLTGLLRQVDLSKIDWSTLLLIAGGITLGRLLETSGIVHAAAAAFPFGQMHPTLTLFILCFASALLSALMSNTATAVMLIPLASVVFPEPSTAILIAVSASFGMPFVVSTPPNAMAYGEGGVRTVDLFVPGLILMIVGCLVVSLTGRAALNLAGIP
jgi:sodium-dependent dicarboxylate transporter 2/3/5